MNPLIKTEHMYKIYYSESGDVHALHDINLNIFKGEFVSIVGHSGSGKSTFMNMIGCLDSPTSGSYHLNGTNVSQLSQNNLSTIRNKEIGFIFQSFNLIPTLTALENVQLPLFYHGFKKEIRQKLALNALEKVGLSDRIKHKPTQMSGGQQQRVAIARAIASNPPIILADEPTGNLDSKTGSQLINIMKELNNDGHTIILITHDNTLAALSKRTVRIHDGEIINDVMNF